MIVMGISCYYHDSAVAIVDESDGIRFAIQEERLSRVKHDSRFPTLAIGRALQGAGVSINDLDRIVFYEDPRRKLRRLWDQVVDGWPGTRALFFDEIPRFVRHKLPIAEQIRRYLGFKGPIEFSDHHRSHAASAFFTSPFERAVVLTLDGVGEYDTAAVHWGHGNKLTKVRSVQFPDSLGLFYSVFTDYLGFEVNEGEYKVMGLASYGTPRYASTILGSLVELRDDGSFKLNRAFFAFQSSDRHYTPSFVKLFGVAPRAKDEPIAQEHMDLAASIQFVLEVALCGMLQPLIKEFGTKDFCFAGGVALNCSANARLVREFGIRSHIDPAAGDAGGALGAALQTVLKNQENAPTKRLPFSPYLGLSYTEAVTLSTLSTNKIPYVKMGNTAADLARRLANGKVIGIVHGRDEWGPRALGARSIIADPRASEMRDRVNAKIKFREEFRPFAPVVKADRYGDYFETLGMQESPYMLYTHKALRPAETAAVVHVDGTSRVQTVSSDQNPYLHSIIDEFEKLTGVPVLMNTSFNLRGEPIVSSPSDALQTFYKSDIDCLAIEDVLVEKQGPSGD